MSLMSCRGCGTLVAPGPRCPRCARAWQRKYDREARPEHHAIYRTARWKKLAAETRAGAVRCTWCLAPLTARTAVADHAQPLAWRPDLAYEPANVVPACRACNNRRGANARKRAGTTTQAPAAASGAVPFPGPVSPSAGGPGYD